MQYFKLESGDGSTSSEPMTAFAPVAPRIQLNADTLTSKRLSGKTIPVAPQSQISNSSSEVLPTPVKPPVLDMVVPEQNGIGYNRNLRST